MKYYAPEEVARVLSIQPPTLRKYAQHLEKYGYAIEKNRQGHRWYSDADIVALQKLMAFKHTGDMDLQAAAQAVSLWAKGSSVSSRDTVDETIHTDTQQDAEQLPQLAQPQLLNLISEQQKAIAGMSELLREQGEQLQLQSEQNAQILAELAAMRRDMQRFNAPPSASVQLAATEPPQEAPRPVQEQPKPKRRSLWAWLRKK
jgi:DNA-binding transcriptional MerR regulator